MTAEVGAMTGAGVAALAAGWVLARPRMRAATGAGKLVALAPVFEAAPLAVFAAEHFTDAHDMAGIVPHWLPAHLFWVYLVGAALLAAAISFIAWRCVRWSAALLALLFLIIVATIDLPNLHAGLHDRFFWILTVRETSFAGGAMVLAGSVWPGEAGAALVRVGRTIVALVMMFYAIEHFLHPLHVVGVPLEKMTPAWIPAPAAIAYLVGLALLVGGFGLLFSGTARMSARGAGLVLLVATFFFYGPILATEYRSPLAVEGLNYVFDTMLFAATVLLAGWGTEKAAPQRAGR
jgi:uncharacterized membrane protein